jgi:hypothetical protein
VTTGGRTLKQPLLENAPEELRKNCDDVKNHLIVLAGARKGGLMPPSSGRISPPLHLRYWFNSSKSSGGSITIVFRSVSMRVQIV